MATSENSWLLMFPNMSTGMKAQMVQNPPPTLSKPTLLRAILDLPYTERDKLIRSIPPPTLKSLIQSIPKAQQQSFFKALQSATSSSNSPSASPPKCPSRKTERDRDTELQCALNLEPSKNGYSSNTKTGIPSETNIDRLPKQKNRGMKRKANETTNSISSNAVHSKRLNVNGQKRRRFEDERSLSDIEAISVDDYEDDVDRYPDRCAAHIESEQFEREHFLIPMVRMMRASGDGPRPSRYSALILLNHIKAFLKALIEHIETAKAQQIEEEELGGTPRRGRGRRSKGSKGAKGSKSLKSKRSKRGKTKMAAMRMELDALESWFPSQVAVFRKWKFLKFESKKHEPAAPDLVNEENNEFDAECKETDDGEGDEAQSMEKALRDSLNEEGGDSVFLEDIGLGIGWRSRLMECDVFSERMKLREYLKFAKCREASLTASPSKFWKWLRVREYHKFTRWSLNFVAWDRIGCIVQIARRLNGYGHGLIIDSEIDVVKPTQIVQAILRINAVEELTPFPFTDKSFDRIDLSNVPAIETTMKRVREMEAEQQAENGEMDPMKGTESTNSKIQDDTKSKGQSVKTNRKRKSMSMTTKTANVNPPQKRRKMG